MKNSILLIALLSSVFSLVGQTISGSVTDEKGLPLAGCNVFVEGTFSGTSTQADGTFTFQASAKDSVTIVAQFIGYDVYRQTVALQPNTATYLDITLTETFNTLNAVTVTAGRYGVGEVEGVAELTSLDMVTTAGSLGDVSAAMQTLPGAVRNGESGRLLVHGGTANETGTYIDGMLVHQPYTTSAPNMAVRGRFNPFMFSGTSFSTGGYSAEYGQALSSILVMNTNDMPTEENLNLSVMTVGADVAGTKMWENGAFTASANYMNLKPYMALIPQNYTWVDEPVSYGGAINFRQQTKGNGLVKVYATFDDAQLTQQQALIGNENVLQTIGVNNKNRFVNANFREAIGVNWVLKGGASYTHNTDVFTQGATNLVESLEGAHTKLTAAHEISAKTHLKIGTEYFYKQFERSLSISELQADSTVSFLDHKVASFVEVNQYLSKKLVLNMGLRAEYSSYLQGANLAPRFAMAYELGKDEQVSFAYGLYYQDPINAQLLSNSRLTYEMANQVIVSYGKRWEERTLRAEAYYKQYNQLVKYPDVVTRATNTGTGYAYGADVYFRDRETIKNGDYWISYSFLQTERDFMNYPEMATPSFANTHTLNIVYKHWISSLRSQVGATFSVGSPRPHNNINSPAFMNERLPAYKSLDVNWSFLFRENIIFHASISNVLGFNNVFGYNYAPTPDAQGTFARSAIVPAANQFFFVGCFITLSKKGTSNQLDKIN